MILVDEDKFSDINDAALLEPMKAVYGNAPVWIGGHYPRASCAEFTTYARHNADPYRIYRDFIRDSAEHDGRVLDIGSASGAQSMLLARDFSEVVGVESDNARLEFARKYNSAQNIKYVNGRFPVDGIGTFDYIFCVSVLYQNSGGKDIVMKAYDALKPGGSLFIYNPDTTDTDIATWGLNATRLVGEFDTCPNGRFVIVKQGASRIGAD